MNQFELKLPNGQTVYTGNIVPETLPLSFTPFPDDKLRPLDEIVDIIGNPDRRTSRQRFGKRVMNQGRRSSCNAFMAAAMLSRTIFLQTGVWHDFAPEFVYMHINGGRDQGSMLDDGMVFVTDNGICRREIDGQIEIRYESFRKSEVPVESMRRATMDAKNFRAIECYQFPTDSPEKCWHAILSCLASPGGTVGLAVHAGDKFMRSGVDAGVDRGPGNHAVPADDIVIKTKRPKSVADFAVAMPNSWGDDFGDNGYSNLSIDHIIEPMRYHGLYGLRSASATATDISDTRLN